MKKTAKKTTTNATKKTVPEKQPAAAPVTAAPAKPAATAKAVKDDRVAFELVQPEAQRVYVAGSFNGWAPEELIPQGNGRWASQLKLTPGRHEYLFVVDGQWMPDPKASETVVNPFGGRNSVVTVSE